MARQSIDIGIQGNDGTGDSIRESFRKVNDNFTQLFAIFGQGDRIAFADLDDTPDGFPNGIPRGEVGSDADKIIIINEIGDALIGKILSAGAGINIDHSDPNQVLIESTNTEVVTDASPTLGGSLDANNKVIARTMDPDDPLAKQTFFNTHGIEITEDDIVISKGYADRNYLQTTGGSGIGSQVRIREEPANGPAPDFIPLEYTITIGNWANGGYLISENHGYNTGINGAKFVYKQTGNQPATGLSTAEFINPATNLPFNNVFIRYIDEDRLGVFPTRNDALNDTNRIIVNAPAVAKDITTPDSTTITGTSISSTLTYTDLIVTSITGTGTGLRVNITKSTSETTYNASNTIIDVVDDGTNYDIGDQLKVEGSLLGGSSPANDLYFNLVTEYRGVEKLVDAFYKTIDSEGYTLDGNWLSNEALPRVSVVRRQGDHMAGPLFLSDHPGSLAGLGSPNGASDLQAATKFYVDSSSFASAVNLFVSTTGDDNQRNTPAGKEGRAFAYAYASVNAACQKAESLINESLSEPGPYRQPITYEDNTYESYITSSVAGIGSSRTLKVYTNGQGVDQSNDIDNKDLREGSIIKGIRSGATAKVIQYINCNDTLNGGDNINDLYVVELLHTTDDITTFQANYYFASDRLSKNKNFIKAEVVAFINGKYPDLEYNQIEFERDVNLIVDSLVFDINYGGNKETITTAVGITTVLPPVQLAETLEGINYIFLLAEQIIDNNIIPAAGLDPSSFGKRGSVTQNTSGIEGEAGSIELTQRLINVILDIVENGENGSGVFLDFIEGETLEYGQPVPELNITLRIESGIYYEQLPIRVPTNVSIKGDEFRRVVIRPAPGVSISPWANLYFYRDSEFDGLTRTFIGLNAVSELVPASTDPNNLDPHWKVTVDDATGVEIGMHLYVTSGTGTFAALTRVTRIIDPSDSFEINLEPVISLNGATVRGLNNSNLAPIGSNFGYHYLTDPTSLSGIFNSAISKTSGNTSAAGLLTSAKSSIQTQVISYINTTYPTLTYNQELCSRDVGYIVESIVEDLINGGTSRSVAAAHSYKRNASARIAVTTQLTETLDGIGYIDVVAQAILASEPTAALIVSDLINGIKNIIVGVNNPAKENKDMDVFLLNDGTILRNITCQGHGGFMCVLDPEGQIQTKSPYIQTATSLSGSLNKQRFAGGMLIDGFSGNLPANIVSKSIDNLSLELTGLTIRKPGVPTSFYLAGVRYQINVINDYDSITGTATVILDSSTQFNPTIAPGGTDIVIETPGNRSMLANDFTQVNDLSYGAIATNNGLTELVSVFSYYNWTSYYAVAGGQIRSTQGNSSYGKYGMRAAGRDPNEVPDPVVLVDNTQQVAKIFKKSTLAGKNLAGQQSIYIDHYQYTPYNISEIEIDHSNNRSSLALNSGTFLNNITLTNPGSGYQIGQILKPVGGITYGNNTYTEILVQNVDPGTGAITQWDVGDPGDYAVAPITVKIENSFLVDAHPTLNTIPLGVAAGAEFTGTYVGSIVRYEVSSIESTTTLGVGVGPGGTPTTPPVLKLNLNSAVEAGGILAPLEDGQPVIIRVLQNIKFNGIEEVSPVRPSTALEFTSASEEGTVYRTLAYNLVGPTGTPLAANEAILTFDSSYNYVIVQSNALNVADTDYVDGGTQTMGSTVGDTRIAVVNISSAKTIARLNAGVLIAWAGKLHTVTGYTAENVALGQSAYITLSDVAYGSGSIITGTGIAESLATVENTILRAGIAAGNPAEITVNISTCRASGHDFLDVGTEGFNSSNYPNNLYGAPEFPPNTASEVIEETQGRVFYTSTDQNGIFRVGRFFTVDQGTGTVTFAASIALSNLDGIGFKRGTVVKEFSTDDTMTDVADDTVPTESAVVGYINKRLGLTQTGAVIPVSERIPANTGGFLPLYTSVAMGVDLNLGNNQIINVGTPGDDNHAATKGYVDLEISKYDQFSELNDVSLINPIDADLVIFAPNGQSVINATVGGVLSSTTDFIYGTTSTLVGGVTGSAVIESGITGTGQASVSGGIVIANITGFPSSGYILIGSEIFSYTSTTLVANRFDNVTRANLGTSSSTHLAGVQVRVISSSGINFQIVDGSILNADVNAAAAIDQSKLNLLDATANTSLLAVKGIASFNNVNFESTNGWISVKDAGISLSKLTNLSSNTIIGNLAGSAATPQEVSVSSLTSNGINTLFDVTNDISGNLLTRRSNSLKGSINTGLLGTVAIADGVVTNVPVISINGTGNGAIVSVTITGGNYSSVAVTQGGNGYVVNEQLRVKGSLLGGVDNVNDLTFTILSAANNIDTVVYFGYQKVSVTADANSIVRTDGNKNLGTPGNAFNNIYSTTFTGSMTGPVSGTILTASQPNITSLGTLTTLSVSGLTILSVDPAITATGVGNSPTAQTDAYAITKQINNITTSSGSGTACAGVRLPSNAAGARIIIRNSSGNNINVYPGTGADISNQGNNVPYFYNFEVNGQFALEFFAVTNNQWYVMNTAYA